MEISMRVLEELSPEDSAWLFAWLGDGKYSKTHLCNSKLEVFLRYVLPTFSQSIHPYQPTSMPARFKCLIIVV
jgi:hypothetical protein